LLVDDAASDICLALYLGVLRSAALEADSEAQPVDGEEGEGEETLASAMARSGLADIDRHVIDTRFEPLYHCSLS